MLQFIPFKCTARFHSIVPLIYQKSSISTSFPRYVKEIQVEENGPNLVISANIKESERGPYLLKNEHPDKCLVCASGLTIKHTDVLILSQFLRSDGCMLPRRITGLCRREQKRMSSLVTMAHKAGLLSPINPRNSKKDPQRRYGFKKFNKYFDETTIKIK